MDPTYQAEAARSVLVFVAIGLILRPLVLAADKKRAKRKQEGRH